MACSNMGRKGGAQLKDLICPPSGANYRARVLCARDRTQLPAHSLHDARRSRV